jgi:hypothetical protein
VEVRVLAGVLKPCNVWHARGITQEAPNPHCVASLTPLSEEQATGLERFELLGKLEGVDVFDMNPIEMTRMGTVGEPIPIYSLVSATTLERYSRRTPRRSFVICRACHLSPVACHLSSVICHLASVICHLWTGCHGSSVICHLHSGHWHSDSGRVSGERSGVCAVSSCDLERGFVVCCSERGRRTISNPTVPRAPRRLHRLPRRLARHHLDDRQQQAQEPPMPRVWMR